MSTSSRSASAKRSSRGPSKTDVLTSRRGPATGGSNRRKDSQAITSRFSRGKGGRAYPGRNPAWRDHYTSGEERALRKNQQQEKEQLLSKVDRVNFFDSSGEVPAAAESRRTPGLACVGEASFDLVFENIRDVDLERRLLSGEAPSFLRLVRLARFWVSERIARPWARRHPANAP